MYLASFLNKVFKVGGFILVDANSKEYLIGQPDKNSIKLKILGSGEIKSKINIEADHASKSAIEKLEKAGGSVQLKK